MPLRQTDRRESDELEDWGWEQRPATREENHRYCVSGLVQRDIGAYGKAEPLMQRALAIYEQALGPTHTNTARSLSNLAELYQTMGSYGKAEPLMQRALAIREKALGPGAFAHGHESEQPRRTILGPGPLV